MKLTRDGKETVFIWVSSMWALEEIQLQTSILLHNMTNHVCTPLRWILKNVLYKAIHSCRITCERSESAQERRIALYKSNHRHHHHVLSCYNCSVKFLISICVSELDDMNYAIVCIQTLYTGVPHHRV